jgi:molybdopterin-guanine dinucleotide biosynthesis protein A
MYQFQAPKNQEEKNLKVEDWPVLKLACYIFAGGKSSRFEDDKARFVWHEKSLLEHVADSIRPFSSKITVVSDQENKYADLGFSTIADINPGLGPLSGLHTSLQHARSEKEGESWILCVSCDRIGIKNKWIEALIAQRTPQAQAIAFKDEIWQPMPGLYQTSILSDVERLILEPKQSIWKLLNQSKSIPVNLPPDWELSKDVNYSKDLKNLKISQ